MELRGQVGGVDFLFPPARDLGIKLWSSGPLPMEQSLGPKTSHFPPSVQGHSRGNWTVSY